MEGADLAAGLEREQHVRVRRGLTNAEQLRNGLPPVRAQ
ncbi:hypothetical protein FHU30_002479 [Actinomadura rupiterrae]|nr:hypothetical protein [Actinomadura rupiterrae]